MPRSEELGFIGMEEFKANLQKLYADISGPVLRDALYAGAAVFREAVEAATPVGSSEYVYRYGNRTVRVKHRSAGRARSSVIVYQRQRRGALSQEAEGLSLLIGHAKKSAWYAYWLEFGRKGQSPKSFMRAAFDGSEEAALAAAGKVIADRIGV